MFSSFGKSFNASIDCLASERFPLSVLSGVALSFRMMDTSSQQDVCV